MPAIIEKYLGNLRVECVHTESGTKIITDAPKDNNGKGEAFSPTDLCAAALGACAMTIIGIYANRENIDLAGATMEINKTMAANPRRIAKIEVIFNMPARAYTDRQKQMIEMAAHSCPVRQSLARDVEQVFTFRWNDQGQCPCSNA